MSFFPHGNEIFFNFPLIFAEDIPGHLRVTSGALAAFIAQSVVYPFDVIRRRNQAHVGRYFNNLTRICLTYPRLSLSPI